ncbi:MAG: chloride channel protein [Candidatus Binatia bacterium]|nr:chloride channel protein [Candidatus Binatia bacterium]
MAGDEETGTDDTVAARGLQPGWAGWRQNLFSVAAMRRHAVWVAAAAASGLGAYLFNYTEQLSQESRAWMTGISPFLPAGVVSISLVIICALRDRVFPGTDGTGIPQTIAALKIPDGPERTKVLSVRIMIGKMLLLVMGLFAGPTIGREGPSVHVAACLMYLSTRFANFQHHLVQRGLILAGGAAGIAAAFNTPIAGAVFAFEEIGRSFEKDNAGTIVRTAVVACIVNLIFLGDYYFYGRIDVGLATLEEWLLVPVIGIVGGLLGGTFAQGVVSVNRLLSPLRAKHPHLVALGLGVGLGVIGLVSGGLSYGSGYPAAEGILIHGESYPIYLAPVVAAGNFITLLSGIPGGLFDPSLTTGAALGQITQPLFPNIDPQALVLLWMVSYFSGVVQSPITAFVILIEMTSAHYMALPLALAALLAYEMSHLICRTSLYESLAESFLAGMQPAKK